MSYRETVPEAEILAYQDHLDAFNDSEPCRVCGAIGQTCAIACPWCGATHAGDKACVDVNCPNERQGQMWIPGTRLVEEILKLGVSAVVSDAGGGRAIIYIGELDDKGKSRYTLFPGQWDEELGHPFDWECIVYQGPDEENQEPLEKHFEDDPDEFDDDPEDEDSSVFTMNIPEFADRIVHFYRNGNNAPA